MPRKAPQPRRRRRSRQQNWSVRWRKWARDLRPTLAGAAIFGLFLLQSVNKFDKDEWIELGAMSTTLFGIIRFIREMNGHA